MLTEVLRLWYEESGQGLVEYALILLFVALACIGGLKMLKQSISIPFNDVAEELR